MKWPMGFVAGLYACGLILGNFLPLLLPLSCLAIISIAFLLAGLGTPRFRLAFLRTAFVFIGWTNFTWHTAILSPNDLRVLLDDQPQLVTIRGTLTDTPSTRVYSTDEGESLHTTARLRVTSVQGLRTAASHPNDFTWQPANGQIIVQNPGELPEHFFSGQPVQIYGVIAPPPLPVAEGLFDYRNYLRREEIYFQLKTESSNDWQMVGPIGVSPPLRDRFTRWAKSALAIGRPTVDAPLHLEQALTLGDKSNLTEDLTEPFMQAATYHIFAVDGLRMAILFGIFFKALRWLRVKRTICGLLLIPGLWFYVDLTGWPPSAIRATVMLTIVIFGWMLKRPVDVLNSLFTAAFFILIWQPQQMFQAGFQLTVCVVWCIILLMPLFDKWVKRVLQFDPLLPDSLRPRWQQIFRVPLRYLLLLFFSSLAACLGSLPLVAYYFHLFSPISAPANVVAVFLCGFVLIANCLSLLLANWLPLGAVVFNFIGWHFMNWIQVSSTWFSHLPGAYTYVAGPSVFAVFAYYGIFFALATGWFFQPRGRKSKLFLLVVVIAIAGAQWLHERSFARLTVLPMNGGSAIYFTDARDRNDLLIDCGNDNSIQFVVKPYLRAHGVNTLPTLALTIGTIQEVGGFDQLQSVIPAKKIITSPVDFRSSAYRKIIQSLETTPRRREVVGVGQMVGRWTVLQPAATNHFTRAEDNALVLRGEIRGARILLLSELGKLGQEALLNRQIDLHADIVVAGLPGQSEPLNDALLNVIQPKLIIVSDSQMPAARRASAALRERLAKCGVPVVYTGEEGAVKVSLKANGWKAETIAGRFWNGGAKL